MFGVKKSNGGWWCWWQYFSCNVNFQILAFKPFDAISLLDPSKKIFLLQWHLFVVQVVLQYITRHSKMLEHIPKHCKTFTTNINNKNKNELDTYLLSGKNVEYFQMSGWLLKVENQLQLRFPVLFPSLRSLNSWELSNSFLEIIFFQLLFFGFKNFKCYSVSATLTPLTMITISRFDCKTWFRK